MRKLTVLVIAALMAIAFCGADASAKTHHKHSAANSHKSHSSEPVEKPVTHLPVPPDAYRA
jgi:ABC-type glycerol-3-phosphate transport system substrate-binding protein